MNEIIHETILDQEGSLIPEIASAFEGFSLPIEHSDLPRKGKGLVAKLDDSQFIMVERGTADAGNRELQLYPKGAGWPNGVVPNHENLKTMAEKGYRERNGLQQPNMTIFDGLRRDSMDMSEAASDMQRQKSIGMLLTNLVSSLVR